MDCSWWKSRPLGRRSRGKCSWWKSLTFSPAFAWLQHRALAPEERGRGGIGQSRKNRPGGASAEFELSAAHAGDLGRRWRLSHGGYRGL